MISKLSSRALVNTDHLYVAAIVAVLFFRFCGTIVFHKSISKLYLIAIWDSFFYPMSSGQSFNMDPSLVQQHLPMRFLVANIWHHSIPLWNPFSGFGVPLLADPNAFVFSPLFALFTFFPGMYTWNIIVILLLLVGALSTYFLCRELELSRLGSLIASLLFTFCPNVQSQAEQVYVSCLIPFVFFFFVRLGKRNSVSSAVLAGLAAAIELLSANPESAFVTIIFASILTCSSAYFSNRDNFKLTSLLSKLALAGIIAFGLTAPVLIPFAEYLRCCDSYKFADIPARFSLQGIITNFLFPFYKRNNLFWGPLSWWGLSAIIVLPKKDKASRFALPLAICLVASIFAIAQLFPISLLFRFPPFSMVLLHYYVIPQYILFVSIISGLGIDRLIDAIVNKSIGKTAIIGIGWLPLMLSIVLPPLICSIWRNANLTIPYVLMIEYPQFDLFRSLINGVCALAMLLVLLAMLSSPTKLRAPAILSFVAIGIFDLLVISYSALPMRPAFQYPRSLPIDVGRADSRYLPIGDHLFKPNTYLAYQLPVMLEWNALHPKGFIEFMRACGARVDKFGQLFPPTINRLVDLTGTRTMISQQPLLDETTICNVEMRQTCQGQVDFGDLVSLRKLKFFFDPKALTVFCCFEADPHVGDSQSWHLCLDVRDRANKTIIYTEPQSIFAPSGVQAITCSSCLPAKGERWSLSLRLVSDPDSQVIQPKKVPFGSIRSDGSWLLATSDDLSLFSPINNDRFSLLSNQRGILTYENRTALDRRFFVSQIKWMNQRESILDYLKGHASELGHIAVLEDAQKEQFHDLLRKLAPVQNDSPVNIFDTSATITKIKTSTTSPSEALGSSANAFQTKASMPALLVVSDLYYPGWKAFVDESECPIFRADYLFRAVLIPPGKHVIKFSYQPLSFTLGIVLFAITICGLLVFFVGRFRKRRSVDFLSPKQVPYASAANTDQ
jgi:hypothetical protein